MPVVRRRNEPITVTQIRTSGIKHRDLKDVPTEDLTKNDWNKLWEAVAKSIAVGRTIRDTKHRNVGSLYSTDGVNLTGTFYLPNSEIRTSVRGKIWKNLIDGEEVPMITLAPTDAPSKATDFEPSGQRSFHGTWPWSTGYEELTITFLKPGNSRDAHNNRVAIVRSRSL